MNHKWKKSKEPITDMDKISCVIAKHTCIVCGCRRTTQRFKNPFGFRPSFSYFYERNHQMYNEYIDCVDWEKESQKEID